MSPIDPRSARRSRSIAPWPSLLVVAAVASLVGAFVGSLVRADPIDDRGELAPTARPEGPVAGLERRPVDPPRAGPSRAGPPRLGSPSREPEALVEPEPDAPGGTPRIEHADALGPFFAALARTEGGQGITRVTNLGDSSIGSDGLPHALRRRFQRTFGDAGPGFVLVQPPSPSYGNRTVRLDVLRSWRFCFIIHRCAADGRYGLGGVSAQSQRGSSTSIRPRDGRSVSRAELWYAAQPRGGRVGIRFGDHEEVLSTEAAALEDRWHAVTQAPGRHEVRVTALGGGPTRVFGVVLENEGPGVVWDSLSMIGAFTRRLLAHDEAHFAEQLARRRPDLVVFNYGGNDLRRVVNGRVGGDGLEEETYELLARTRAAVPDAACLLVGISDHQRSGESDVRPAHVARVLDAQRAAAARAGCAFWDTTAAMGGPGSFRRWSRRGLASRDGKHLSEAGRQVVAARLHAALLDARRAATSAGASSSE